MTTERRKNPRVQILGKLHGHIVALDADQYDTGIQFADEVPDAVADLMDRLS
jgi:hypothetical protein